MAFCANCGAAMDGRFCQKCGAPAGVPGAGPTPGPVGVNPLPPPAPYGIGPTVGMTDNMAGALCYLFGFITGILFLVLAPYNQDRNIRFHAFQSIFLNIAWVILWFVGFFVTRVFRAVPFLGFFITAVLNFVLGLG